MKRYLLFESACALCTRMAEEIESEANGWLVTRSLRDKDIQELLQQARPGWKWEPTLLEVEAGQVSIYTGLPLALRLGSGLGVQRSWRILRLVGQLTQPAEEAINPERRRLLRNVSAMAAGLAILPKILEPKPLLAEGPSETLEMPTTLEGEAAATYVRRALESTDVALLEISQKKIEMSKVVVHRYAAKDEHIKHTVFLPVGRVGYIIYSVSENINSQQISDSRALYYKYDKSKEVTLATVGGIDYYADLDKASANGQLQGGDSVNMACNMVDQSSCDVCPTWGIQEVSRKCCETSACCVNGRSYTVVCCCVVGSRGPCRAYC